MINPYFKQNKASQKHCPRCSKPLVDKARRRCLGCQGLLYWYGDDCQYAESRRDDFYIWHKSIFGNIGWYHSSYFRDN